MHSAVQAETDCLGRSSSAKDLGAPQTAVSILDALLSPPRVWVPEGLRLRPAGWAELYWKRSCRKTQPDFPPSDSWELLSVKILSLLVTDWPIQACACARPWPPEPPLVDKTAKPQLISQLDMVTCLVTMDLSGHHQPVLEAGHHLQACTTHPTPIVWDGHWLERLCHASLGIELKFQLPVPQGTTSPHCALTQTTEHDPLSVSWQQGKTAASWTVSTSSTPMGEGIVPLTPWPLAALKNCVQSETPEYTTDQLNWSQFSGGRQGWHWGRALCAPWGEAKGWNFFESEAAVVSGTETFHSSDIFKTKLSSLARMFVFLAGGWTDTS